MITKEDSKESHRECWNIYRRIATKLHIRKTKSHTIKILKEMNMDGVQEIKLEGDRKWD